jgi:hypothetical protein
MSGTVYVTHCIDTEGPLYESIDATFERVESIFDIDIEHTQEKLEKLQKKSLDLDGIEEDVRKVVAPKQIDTKETWDQILEQLERITSSDFRQQYSDSFDDGWIYNWFIMDHVGFSGENPRRRTMGHHAIYDQYRQYMNRNNVELDDIYWHYHPLSIRKDAHRSGTAYLNSDNIYKILSKKIIDRSWFPTAYRPGFHTERPDSHWFLEQWIPFDFGNQSGKTADGQPDLSKGRFGTWNRAPEEWHPYNPAYEDYQSRGNCNRYITRCLNMDTRHKNITKSDIRDAFVQARETGDALLAFTDHDFRDMDRHIGKVWNMISTVNSEFDDVSFKHTTAVEGIREVVNMESPAPPKLEIEQNSVDDSPVIKVSSQNEIFGRQPFLAIKTKSGEYYWDNFDFPSENVWTYTFDFHTLPMKSIETVGIAANSPTGVGEVLNYDPELEHLDRQVWYINEGVRDE